MRVRKRPIEVEAWHYNPRADTVRSVRPPAPHYLLRWNRWRHCWQIKTLEGWLSISLGDWIIRGVHGEWYPCKPDIFKATYEEAWVGAREESDG